MRIMYNQLFPLFNYFFFFFVNMFGIALLFSLWSVDAINTILGRGPQPRDASLLYYKERSFSLAENPTNTILHRTSDNLATYAAKPQTPRRPHAVRPSLFGVPIRVREPDDICDVENEGQNDDGDEGEP